MRKLLLCHRYNLILINIAILEYPVIFIPMKKLNLRNNLWWHLAFWCCVLVFSIASANWYYSTFTELIEVYTFKVLLQMLFAYTMSWLLLPKILNKKGSTVFAISLLALFAIIHALCTSYLVYYLVPNYSTTYTTYLQRFESTSFQSIYFNFNHFFSTSLYYAYPCVILVAISFYIEKQKLLELHEKKREAELNALKNQLNPHFLFNTLNSLYLLALKKSEKTIKVIENLSHILDYMLYRCDKKYVLLRDELTLINKYLELEQIRYGKRVNVIFDESITGAEKIAPLLLLTFVENAFKHGVSEEINMATIQIKVANTGDQLYFELKNSKPPKKNVTSERKALGLLNVRKQLELLYPKTHELKVTNTENTYKTQLQICL